MIQRTLDPLRTADGAGVAKQDRIPLFSLDPGLPHRCAARDDDSFRVFRCAVQQ